MALVIKDRVKETTTTTGTGTINLAGAASGFQSFVSGVGDGNTTYYVIEDANGTAWEVGIGTITDASPDTLARTTVLASTNSNSQINLSSGTHTVFGTYPAGKAVYLDASGNLSHTVVLTTDTSGNYVATITGGTGITSTGATSGEGIAHSLSVDASQTQITAVGTIATGTWQGTAIAQAYIANDAINGDKIADDAVNSEHYAAGSIDEEHLNATNTPTDNYILSYDDASGGFTWVAAGAGEANEYSFKTISVSGQDDVVADTTTDTLTLAAGSNVTITTTAASDTVTIAAADTNTQLSTEEVQDIVGGMVTGNTETGITVTYEDGDGTLDFVVGTLNQDTTGNAATATALETARTINGTSFDGTANITITAAGSTLSDTVTVEKGGTGATSLTDGGVLLGSGTGAITATAVLANGELLIGDNSTDPTVATLTAGSNVTITNGAGSITIASTDTNTQLTTEQVQDIAGGMFSSNTETLITATYQDADGTVDLVVDNDLSNYDNSSSGFITATLTTEQVQDIVGGMVTGNTETGIAVTYEDGDGTLDFVVGTLNQDTTGNAATATALETARTINGTSFDGTANITVTAAGSTLSDTVTVAKGGTGQTSYTNGQLLIGNTTGNTLAKSTLTAGSNVTITNGTGSITIAADNDNTQLSEEQVEDFVGGMVTGNTETGIAVTYEDGDGTLDFVVSDTTVAGDSGSTGITPGDTLTIAGGTNATTAMSGDTLTVNVDDAFLKNDADDTTSGKITAAGYAISAVVTESGTSRTLADSDNGKVIVCTNGSATTITVPASLATGFAVTVIQTGAGQITFSASSTTINNRQSHTKTAGQHARVGLVQTSSDTYNLGGDTAS